MRLLVSLRRIWREGVRSHHLLKNLLGIALGKSCDVADEFQLLDAMLQTFTQGNTDASAV